MVMEGPCKSSVPDTMQDFVNELIKKYGINLILALLVKDLQILGTDQGYPFPVFGGSLYLRGSLLAVLADTPAAQSLGGFKEGVGGARRKCRHCMTNFEQMQNYYKEEEFLLRTKEDHEEHLNKIENAPSKYLKEYYSKHFGINRRTNLINVPHFDVCEQLPQDVMHLFLEGILSYHLKYLFHHYITEISAFTLLDLNREIKHFPLGYGEEKDRPVVIKENDLLFDKSTNLGQSAAQMQLLCNILPFILGMCVDLYSVHWKCFMSLLEIMMLCFSHSISYAAILVLKNKIASYLPLFKELYNARITPKLHYLVHVPSLMFMFGPLIRSWCMRFEAKHSYFKNIAKVIRNFKNLPLSLSTRHQSMECADNIVLNEGIDPCPLIKKNIVFGSSKPIISAQDISYVRECLFRFYNIQNNQVDACNIFLLSSVTIYGTVYKPGKNNFIDVSKNAPEFGRIIKIWYVEYHGIFFVIQVMHTTSFCEELNTYEIEEPHLPEGQEILASSEISHPKVCHTYQFNEKLYIVQRENTF
ncbi:uncharacterized protein LOC116286933 [Actinia tenebrosa]|uniref:Uncharacterized protein LOC116286933 n=1 Tax=Actinia tenebrosa TaxID=6105 RepID=A0A6P8H144_ACTTE|nr:uncharacterized protein LOC116286933 [Actinia tenebrosa]